MGFVLSSLALLVLTILIAIFKPSLADSQNDAFTGLQTAFDEIAGYGLGGSTVALFGRVGGGIYTKAADVGADLVGKIEEHFKEDSPQNPATIADNVGDNVGDIAGMGADLFGSFAEASSAALVVLSDSNFAATVNGINGTTQVYLFAPPVLSAIGIICCLFTSFFATDIMSVDEPNQIENTLKWQLIISTVLLLGGIYLAFGITLNFPGNAPGLTDNLTGHQYPVEPWRAYVCSVSGLLAGFIIGWFTEYYTSNAYTPVQEVAGSCRTGAATNIIYGLALGYLSTIIPIVCLAVASYVSHKLLGLFGVALAALGMLSNLAVGLAIDAYGPISDNAGGIAEMSDLGEHVRERTDALDAAGNTTAAIGKGFAIGSAALVSLALYSAFITRASRANAANPDWITLTSADISVTDGLVFSGLLIGAMLPYAFSAFTMKSVGTAANGMVNEIRRQLKEHPGIKIPKGEEGHVDPDYNRCVAISTEAALREMIAPGCLVIFTPLVVGFLLGPKAVAGLLPGALVSGVQMAISASNTGGAWDNAKKYIEAGKFKVVVEEAVYDKDGNLIVAAKVITKKKGSKEHEAAVIGDTVGDPLKDTSGPSLNILIKLSAILSLVFVTFFRETAYLTGPFGEKNVV